MTTIGSTSYSAFTSRYAAVERSKSNTDFADQTGQEAASSTKPRPDKLTSLLTELKELEKQQLNMSIGDYLLANFTLKEQISTERLNAGEDLDVIGVRFEGRVFNLAGKLLGSLDALKVSDRGVARLATPEDKLRSYLAQQQIGVDSQVEAASTTKPQSDKLTSLLVD